MRYWSSSCSARDRSKCMLFKEVSDVDAFPISVQSKDTDTIVQTIEQISGSFGGINVEDFVTPKCF